MADLFDYLKWRGDLPVSVVSINNVDALILSRLSYIPLDNIVPEIGYIALDEAARIFLDSDNAAEKVIMYKDIDLLHALMNSIRFQNMRLSGYIRETDEATQKQFAALTIDTGDGAHFLSFRGTDNTLLGWKEDFNMSFMSPVPSQLAAVRYTELMAKRVEGWLRLGGHSKGGNLAVYAASFCRAAVQERILEVYNNDGPGLPAVMLTMKGYLAILGRIHTFVPQSSVVGLMLEHEEGYMIIHSSGSGFVQHDLYTWETTRDNFVFLDAVTNGSRFIDRILKDLLIEISPEQRGQFIDAMYSIFRETGANTIKEMSANWYHSAQAVLSSLKELDPEVRQLLAHVLLEMLKSAKHNLPLLRQ